MATARQKKEPGVLLFFPSQLCLNTYIPPFFQQRFQEIQLAIRYPEVIIFVVPPTGQIGYRTAAHIACRKK